MMSATSGDELSLSPVPPSFVSDVPLHHLQRGDVFLFLERQATVDRGKKINLPSGNLKVSIPPWGPKSPLVGPIGPWMFASRDERGVEHHFALPPRLVVRRLLHGTQK